MATKHYFPDTAANTLVPRALRALVLANPHLTLSEAERVVANSHNDRSTVSIIGGGGSGHEPAWSGFVGEGLLSAVACGDIFASPSTKQVLEAMRLAPSDAGTILLITNYTGDRLHFGLAAERAKASGLSEKVVVLPATDDVSIGRSKSSRVGRRGMPGHIFTMKILGAAAAEKYRFDQCVEIGRAVNDQTVSIGSALDHCHVPGRQYHSVAEDVCVVGAGIHNEPGQQLITPFPSVNDLIDRMLKLLCDQNDAERAFVSFEKGDEITLLINNYGGLSVLELGALTDEVQTQLASTWSITPVRTQVGTFETSLNAPGFSISLCNISAAARQLKSTAAELLQLLDRPTSAVYWPNTVRPVIGEVKANGLTTDKASATNSHEQKSDLSKVDPKLLENAIRSACERAIAAEPNLTKWDMVMGDGDCGEAVKGLCESLLRNLDNGSAASGSVFAFLESTVEAVDDMGGTLGAILGILLSAFTSSLRSEAQANPASTRSFSPMLYASSLASAVESLKSHTPAREGDRTVMDVLIPFSDAFVKSGDFGAAVKVAAEKAEATRYLKARFGRATYVGDAAGQELPDPGAWALYEFLLGMTEA
ncbi:dihydroxyacetone kinase [Colletotrichum scovillei]|uniref:Dihydroxyacetone kinase n=1 Tax=Colletotrichum scovillei TaxID=1209932 RepID=A0A9P7QV42_9PEZI|nr:dihydroxyacetone kinase [Colletotrichum scovillei]KAG7046101.1 dihydroxyacetone kinase [Colletotrichum scovillei]KAG7063449.1 dihydroxyacetone kinase [Colletotrichum scovillei]